MVERAWRGAGDARVPRRERAVERRALEILERRECDWVDAWRAAEAEREHPSHRTDREVAPGRKPRVAGRTVPVMRSAERSGIEPGAAELVARARHAGAPLEPGLRSRLETALGAPLDQVRIHTGAEADAAARALHARAFAIGNDVIFRDGAYAPAQRDGQRLIAHEIAHIVQARGAAGEASRHDVAALAVSEPGDALEREADAFAEAFTDGRYEPARPPRAADPFDFRFQDARAPAVTAAATAAAHAIHRTPDDQMFAGFSQGASDSCGAASVVSALMIWDNQHASPSAPHEMVVNACNILLTEMAGHRPAIIARLETARAGHGESLYNAARSELTALRDLARTPGSTLDETSYQALANVMYLMYSSRLPGMQWGDVSSLVNRLGLGGGATDSAPSFDGLFATGVLRGLTNGQIAQVSWYAQQGRPNAQGEVALVPHIFLIGRFESGNWFFSDQGSSPPAELIAGTLPALKTEISVAASGGTTQVYTGTPSSFALGLFTGVRVLGDRGGVEHAAQVVTPGTFLAEVDAGPLTIGDRLIAGDFVVRAYSFAEARTALGGTGSNGGLIVEMPRGVFSLYKTNLVRDANLNVTGIDEEDSAGGLLARHTFFAAWLLLCSANACRATPLQVY